MKDASTPAHNAASSGGRSTGLAHDAGSSAGAGTDARAPAPADAGRVVKDAASMTDASSAPSDADAARMRQPCDKTDDNARGALELVTLSLACKAGHGDVAFSRLTPNARYLVFQSDADDLVPNDLNGGSDIFFYDLQTRELELVSKKYGDEVPPTGYSFQPVPSDDGRYVAFTAYTFELSSPPPTVGGLWIYVRDRLAGTTRRLPADYACAYWVDMSGDAAFLVAEGLTNCQESLGSSDHYSALEYDLKHAGMRVLGTTGDGTDNAQPAISRDGRFVVWGTQPTMTRSTPTAQLQIFDRTTGQVDTLPFREYSYESTDISDSGNVLAFSTGGQVLRYERDSDMLRTISVSTRATLGDGGSYQVSLSGDGRRLVFKSEATDLIDGDTNGVADVFLYDAQTQALQRISLTPDGGEADGDSEYPYISADGTKVSFASKARNLLPAATSGDYQLYILTLGPS